LTYHWAYDTERLVDFAVHPIRDDQGKILFLHPTGVDITDLKRAEEKYRALAESLDAEVRIRTTEVVQQAEQLRDLSSRLLQAQDEERRHIARELHDSAGQILTALSMSLAMASQHAPQESAGLAKHLEESEALAQQLSQEIRTMSYLLHPPLLDETGLSEALRWYIQGLSERSGLEITLDVPEDFTRLSREMELVMFRLVQESLTNIHRHSDSKSAVIRLRRNTDNVSLEVQDHGKGISAEKLSEIQSQGSGVGIRGMRERARHFGGHMMIESSCKGTKISFQFPLSGNATAQPADIRDQENSNQPAPIVG
jgi:signal transduction histidine kinase